MTPKKNLKVNSILNIVKTLSNIIFPLITFPYVSRILQPENMGKVNFALLASLGITTYAIRECSAVRKNSYCLEEKASEIFSINICTTVIAYVLLAMSLFFFQNLASYKTLIVVQSTTIVFATLGADWLNMAMEDFSYITIRTILFQFLSLLLLFLFVKNTDDYIKYACISVVASSGANIFNIFHRRKYCAVHFTRKIKWKVHMKPIFFLFVMILAQTIFNSADVTMLGLMKGDYEVGIYSTAVKIENLIAQVVSSLAWVVMPRMSSYFEEEDYESINKILEKILGIFFLIGLPAIVGVLSLSKEIVLIAGGEKYIGSALPLKILMIAFFFNLIGGSFLGNIVFLPSRKEKEYMVICCIATVVNLLFNYVLIPYWGASAAAGTTAFSAFLIMILLFKRKNKNLRFSYWKRVAFQPIVGSAIIGVYCFIIGILIKIFWIKIAVSVLGSIFLYGLTMIYMENDICIKLYIILKNKFI